MVVCVWCISAPSLSSEIGRKLVLTPHIKYSLWRHKTSYGLMENTHTKWGDSRSFHIITLFFMNYSPCLGNCTYKPSYGLMETTHTKCIFVLVEFIKAEWLIRRQY